MVEIDPKPTESLLANIEAEEALIGCVLIDPSQYNAVGLSPGHFYIVRHQYIWRAIGKLIEDGKYPDLVLITDYLDRHGQLPDVDGFAGLTKLLTATPSALHAPEYATLVRENYTRRHILTVCQDIVRDAINTVKPIESALSSAIDSLSTIEVADSGIITFADVVSVVYDEVENKSKNPQRVYGMSTGFLDFDNAFGGLHPPELFDLAGAPGIGKSKFALQMAINLANPKIGNSPGTIFSLEMNAKSLGYRAISADACIPTESMFTGHLGFGEWDKITAACGRLTDYPLYICENAGLTIDAMRAELYRAKTRYGAKWFLLDYLALLGGYEHLRDDNQRLSNLSREVKRLCSMFDMAGIAINAVVKEGMGGGAPKMTDMRGPSQVMHDADIIAFLVESDTPGVLDMVFKKVRNHPVGYKIQFRAERDFPAFRSLVLSNARDIQYATNELP